ncbi:hypothetical protein [Thioalbus denitrificans]|uniref:Nucleotidyltransferase-like protein n=1 Tax=Thioalbus denitrificans TaxID=547122 RepID=A0A369CJC8_9GAMM|nr:hypothetical protein [Thioalbus denitrificans]RCX32806.1 hypothetical protein DFQ59_101104 [Thioalbus denitrificans]
MARVDKLRARRIDPQMHLAKAVNEVYERLDEDDAVRYAVGAMLPIDPEYTNNTFAESDRIQGQLVTGYDAVSRKVEFEHQGSVTSDTHIKAHSDIDLLVIETRFVSLEHPLQPSSPYKGDPLQDLLDLRGFAEDALIRAYPKATVDCSGSKAVAISGGSLRRKIDVVFSSWLETPEYKAGHGAHYRGVSVLDKDARKRISNKPFLHNARIHERDQEEIGNLRKVIRLLKSLKYDADEPVRFSSYDIASVAWAAPQYHWMVPSGQELLLVEKAANWLDYLSQDQAYAMSLSVPNGTRKIFCEDGASFRGLDELRREVHGLLRDIRQGLARSFRKLEEARILY